MKREIRSENGLSALLETRYDAADITVYSFDYVANMADMINESDCVDVLGLERKSFGFVISLHFSCSKAELTEMVCEAISEVYDVDTFVSCARAE